MKNSELYYKRLLNVTSTAINFTDVCLHLTVSKKNGHCQVA